MHLLCLLCVFEGQVGKKMAVQRGRPLRSCVLGTRG